MESTMPEVTNVLEHYDMECIDSERLKKGHSNSKFLVKTRDGLYLLRKYSKPGDVRFSRKFRNVDTVAYEHFVLEYAASQGFPCVAPLPNSQGQTITEHNEYLFALFPFIDGETRVSTMKVGLQSARLLGKFHRLMANFPIANQRPFWGYKTRIAQWFHQNEVGIGTADEIMEWCKHLEPTTETEEYISANAIVLEEALNALAQEFPADAYDQFPVVVNHGDYYQANIGVVDGQVNVVYDFDDCTKELRMYDLAKIVGYHAGDCGKKIDFEKARELVGAYRQESEISGRELALFPYMLFAEKVHLLLGVFGVVRSNPEYNPLGVMQMMLEPLKWLVNNRAELSGQFARI